MALIFNKTLSFVFISIGFNLVSYAALAIDLAPHRAVYALSLGKTESGQAIYSQLSGRLVFEIDGGDCTGYSSKYRFVMQTQTNTGDSHLSDLRYSSWESPKGNEMSFVSQQYLNETLVSESKGKADITNGTTSIELEKPNSEIITDSSEIFFPNTYVKQLLEGAKAGKNFMELSIFDGAESGKQVFLTSVGIGKKHSNNSDDPELYADLSDVDSWPIAIAYYKKTDQNGEQIPDYQQSARIFANGVSGNMRFDYGSFQVDANLTDLEMLSSNDCE